MRTARGLRTSIDDETALAWGPKVTAAKDMSLTPEEAALLQQNGTAANGQGRNSPLQGISGISQEVPDHAIAELNSRNIVLSTAFHVCGRLRVWYWCFHSS